MGKTISIQTHIVGIVKTKLTIPFMYLCVLNSLSILSVLPVSVLFQLIRLDYCKSGNFHGVYFLWLTNFWENLLVFFFTIFRVLFHRCTDVVSIFSHLFIFGANKFSTKCAKINGAWRFPLLRYYTWKLSNGVSFEKL